MCAMSFHRPAENGRDEIPDEYAATSPFALQQHLFLQATLPHHHPQAPFPLPASLPQPHLAAFSQSQVLHNNFQFLQQQHQQLQHHQHHQHQQLQHQQHQQHQQLQQQQLQASIAMFEPPQQGPADVPPPQASSMSDSYASRVGGGNSGAAPVRNEPRPFMPSPSPQPQTNSLLQEVNAEFLVQHVNPQNFSQPHGDSRCFVIKSYSEEDIHRAIKYSIWCSSRDNNNKLNEAYKLLDGKGSVSGSSSAVSTPSSTCGLEPENHNLPAFLTDRPMVYLFFSVNGSGHFCGVARLASQLFAEVDAGVWSQSGKWKGMFRIRWLYVKDVPNAHLRHIRLPNNENKPVTNTRDCHEVPLEQGSKVLSVIHSFQYTTTLFDDYDHYDRLEKEKKTKQRK